MNEIKIFDTSYEQAELDTFEVIEEAVAYELACLPTDDQPYMIGFDDEILGFIFQGRYYESSDND